MRILRVVHDYPMPWKGLGPGPYEMTQTQARNGHEVMVVSAGWPTYDVVNESQANVTHVRVPRGIRFLGAYGLPSLFAALVILYHQIRRKPDVIHGHTAIMLFYNLIALLWKPRCPYVYHMHTSLAHGVFLLKEEGRSRYSIHTRFMFYLGALCDWAGVRAASYVIATSETIRKKAIQLSHADPRRVEVVENGVNTKLFNYAPSNVRDELNISTGAVLLIFVGALIERKYVHTIIDVLSFLPSRYELMLVGDGPEGSPYVKQLRDRVQELKLSNRVHFVGDIPYLELNVYYRDSNLLVLLSSYEGFPKVVLEALACGIPVLSTKSFGVEGPAKAFIHFLSRVDPRHIAEVIQQLPAKRLDADQVSKVTEYYDWNEVMKRIERFYH